MRQHGVLLTLVLSPKPHPECEQIAADHNSRSWMMHQASPVCCCQEPTGLTVLCMTQGRSSFVRSNHPYVQLNRFVSKHDGTAHT